MRWVTALLMLGAASCAVTSTDQSSSASWLARFADAVRFVPPGMQSHWFSDHRNLGGDFAALPGPLRVQCARNFQAPRDVGIGAYEGVTIQDHGAGPIPADVRVELGEPRASIASTEVRWRSGLEAGTNRVLEWETWSAIVDERFVVSATSEALLRQALARNGEPSFGTLEPLPDVDPATVELVLRDLSGTPAVDARLQRNVPGGSAIAAPVATPLSVTLWARDPCQLHALREYCFSTFTEDAVPCDRAPVPASQHHQQSTERIIRRRRSCPARAAGPTQPTTPPPPPPDRAHP